MRRRFKGKIIVKIPPQPPVEEIVKSNILSPNGRCKKCGSSLHRRKYWLFGPWDGCIQPRCRYYYKNK